MAKIVIRKSQKDTTVGITQPFDPTKINIIAKQMSLDTLVKRIKHDEIVLSPDFQRKEVWKKAVKSRLIESLLIRIPLPAFYMDATNEDKWLVVDGLQRLSTIRDYVIEKENNNKLTLQGLEYLKDFEGYGYDDLPRNYQRRIDETQVTVYLIEKGTPGNVKFNVFKRINTGGLPLSAQEIRHALNQGPASKLLIDLAASKEFITATGGKISDTRMSDKDAILRCLAFMITSYKNFPPGTFDDFLSNAMKQLNESSDETLKFYSQRFLQSMSFASDIFGDNAFRKPKNKEERSVRLPINKALIETWICNFAELSKNELILLRKEKARLINAFVRLIEQDKHFEASISQGTGKPEKVRYRFQAIEKLIHKFLK